MNDFVNSLGIILFATLVYATPLIYAAMGSCFSEVSGVVNIGIEGMMTAGAFTGTVVAYFTGNPWIGFICGGLAGAFFGMLHAVATVRLGADQTIAGTAINMMGPGVVIMLARVLFDSTDTAPLTADQKIPEFFANTFDTSTVFGRFMDNVFATYASTYIVFIVVIVVWFIFYKTRFGLRLMACGEHPQAAASVGINVYKMRWAGVLISGALGGLGGIVFITAGVSEWRFEFGVAGFGFLALAVMIFGQWNPIRIALSALLFGLFRALSNVYMGFDFLTALNLPSQVYNMMPYIISLVVLAFTSKKSRAPKAEGIPYDKGQR